MILGITENKSYFIYLLITNLFDFFFCKKVNCGQGPHATIRMFSIFYPAKVNTQSNVIAPEEVVC